MPELTQQLSSENPEWTQQLSRNKRYKEVLLPEITALNADMEILHRLAVSFNLGETNDKNELMKTLGKVRERAYIWNLLPALEQAIWGLGYTRAWLEHTLYFQYGFGPEQIEPDSQLLGTIITTSYLWRIIWPLLIQVIEGQQITLPLKQFNGMLLSCRWTPEDIKKRILAIVD